MRQKTKPQLPSTTPVAPGSKSSPDDVKTSVNGAGVSVSTERKASDQADADLQAIEDERMWGEAFAGTTEEDFARLLKWADELAKDGTKPLDFTDK